VQPPRGGPWTRGPLGPTHWTEPVVRVRVRSNAGAGDGMIRDGVLVTCLSGGVSA
jgi:hypothetical protein